MLMDGEGPSHRKGTPENMWPALIRGNTAYTNFGSEVEESLVRDATIYSWSGHVCWSISPADDNGSLGINDSKTGDHEDILHRDLIHQADEAVPTAAQMGFGVRCLAVLASESRALTAEGSYLSSTCCKPKRPPLRQLMSQSNYKNGSCR